MPRHRATPKRVLDTILHPQDIATLPVKELKTLADEIREEIIAVTANNGGHLAPALGVVELTIALLSEFNPSYDKLIWDVGHQSYAYKILTQRNERFHSIRTYKGLSGFPRLNESSFDHFGTGHSSTSISAGLGMALARDIKREDFHVASIIGDGAMTAGMAFEALNHAGHAGKRLIVVLNDNEMSISRNVGALSLLLSRSLSTRFARKAKAEVENLLSSIPAIGEDILSLLQKGQSSLKTFFTSGMLFEALGFNYVGPVDGHNIERMKEIFLLAKPMTEPVLIHVLTQKGKGYAPAEKNPSHFHGVGRFTPSTGESEKLSCGGPSYTEYFSKTICSMAESDPTIVGITAAMPAGTGLDKFAEEFPDRYFDVGICEQHAVTFAAGLASQGMHPVVAIYSTFMQRAFDQIVHDVCIQNLPVILCLDRAGLVGEDGPTHHGAFDLSFLRSIPGLSILAPASGEELSLMLEEAVKQNSPVAIRYPRGCSSKPCAHLAPITWGRGEIVQEGHNIAVLSLGARTNACKEAAILFEEKTGQKVTIFNSRFLKPLPEKQIQKLASTHTHLLIVEENALAGGFSGAVLEFLTDSGIKMPQIKRLGLQDEFIEHGATSILLASIGLDTAGILTALEELFSS